MEYTVLIVLLPMLTFFVLGLLGKRLGPCASGLAGTLSMGVTAALSYATAWQYFTTAKIDGVYQKLVPLNFEWLRFTDKLHIDLGVLLDPISVMMLIVISTVSLMVHIYSMGYMKGERGFERYYAFLSLFSCSMLGLVVATNIFQMYIFWELVGVSSYLLIGFYYTKPEAIAASKKAFIVTRFADLFFLIGILLLSFFTGTFDFGLLTSGDGSVFSQMSGLTFMGGSVIAWALALIFIGGAGKSAMFPLHIWLPDAMEGPTPVSALIHAATMVVAGVYLVARLFPVYYFEAPEVLHGIAYLAAFTSLFAAVIACVQTDIKRVLAFSTISQIGFMMVALGVSGYGGHEGLGYMAGMFHLFTHAMFKALLFLGAGAIIHAVHSNEMSRMGGLRKQMPVTHVTFLIACLAIAGIPPFSGFFSKDEILAATFEFSTPLGWWMSLTAGLTAFYMFRLYYNIFWATPAEHEHEPHEAAIDGRSAGRSRGRYLRGRLHPVRQIRQQQRRGLYHPYRLGGRRNQRSDRFGGDRNRHGFLPQVQPDSRPSGTLFQRAAPGCEPSLLYRRGVSVRHQEDHFQLHIPLDRLVRPSCDRRRDGRSGLCHEPDVGGRARSSVRSDSAVCLRVPARNGGHHRAGTGFLTKIN